MRIYTFVKPTNEHMTVAAVRNRFTMEERIAIEEAAETSAQVRVIMADLAASTYVDRFDPNFLEGLNALEQAGLIAEGRASEIQEAPVQDFERP